MRFINPLEDRSTRTVLAGLYPFMRGSGGRGRESASLTLKAECLVQTTCTVPGSMALQDGVILDLLRANVPLIEAGLLVLDLRSSARSFNELAAEKFGRPPDDVARAADFLDRSCPAVLHFRAESSSDRYREMLVAHLTSARARSRGARADALDAAVGRLGCMNERLTLAAAEALRIGDDAFDARLPVVVRYYYSLCGAETLTADLQLPEQAVSALRRKVGSAVTSSLHAQLLSRAHDVILWHFVIDRDALARLGAEDIVEIRSDGIAIRLRRNLEDLVEQLMADLVNTNELRPKRVGDLAGTMRSLHDRIAIMCRGSRASSRFGEGMTMAVEELTSLLSGAPGVGLARKGVMAGGRWLSRKDPSLAWADVSMSPVRTYATRVREAIEERS